MAGWDEDMGALDAELWFELSGEDSGEECDLRAGSNVVTSMTGVDLSDTDLPQLEEEQDFCLGIQLVKICKLIQAINPNKRRIRVLVLQL